MTIFNSYVKESEGKWMSIPPDMVLEWSDRFWSISKSCSVDRWDGGPTLWFQVCSPCLTMVIVHIYTYAHIHLYYYTYIHIMHIHVHRHIDITYTHLLMFQPQLHATPAPKPRGFHSPIFYAHPTWWHSLDHVIQVWTQGRIWSGAISGQVVIYWRYLLYI